MKKEDLVEFLGSVIEEEAIISRLYNLFHLQYGYEIEELNNIVQYGVEKTYFAIKNIDDSEVRYDKVDWENNNNFQEIIMINDEDFVKQLFS